MQSQDQIEQFIRELLSDSSAPIGPDQPLISSGALDSLGLLRLITFLEEQMGVTIGDGEVVPENFETIRSISNFVDRKASK